MRFISLPLVLLFACNPSPGDDTTGETDSPVESDTPADSDAADTDETDLADTDVAPPVSFCRAWYDCPGEEICDLPTGRCEVRSVWTEARASITSFRPPVGAPGDVLVVDGTRLSVTPIGNPDPLRLGIGDDLVPLYPTVKPDSTRLIAIIPEGAQGAVRVTNENGAVIESATPFVLGEPGVFACDETSPAATGTPGGDIDAVGPHAAGYVDIEGIGARIYYPASCGGVRRPAVPGTYPLVGILHSDGTGFIQHEYIAQRLATWGIISAMVYRPAPPAETEVPPETVDDLSLRFGELVGNQIGQRHPAMAGLVTSDDVAWIGHGRGAARIQVLLQGDANLRSKTRGGVFLGAIEETGQVPGLFLLVHGSRDLQSLGFLANLAWNRQEAPKWRLNITGGNHSLHTDHKVWTGFLDQQAEISRRRQLKLITTFVLPLMQRAFELDEPFAYVLDDPLRLSGTTVARELP